ncbi:transcription factor VOZ1-like [Asparagus officinalis]|uniref:transcription factor VOZ1-like n=1 Tax=Asparagus officinalis TaxID=4686 RepID=UPI00098E2FE4|nr:transcription factor VOZ1-like [Asparagus officinalis]
MVRGSNNQQFKDKAKNRVADLEGMFTDLQSARLEEQVHQLLREWKAELCEASPGNSLIGDCKGDSDLSSEIWRLLHIGEEEDDATSKLEEIVAVNSKAEPAESGHENGLGGFQGEEVTVFEQEHFVNQELSKHGFLNIDEYKSTPPTGSHHAVSSCSEKTNGLSYEQFNLHEEVQRSHYINNFEGTLQNGGNIPHHQELSHISEWLPAISPPASAFLNPKCALWDCPRPAEGKRWCQDYCCSGHASLALSEGLPGMNPVLRPGGIDLKDGPLFAALAAKTQGKIVGIPECEGAATTKSPWNAPELFDLSFLEGELLREWLFFDKPRRAFESGSRKQRSLPDYNGRGWHESRKQVMKEFGGLKRSYYMDPQPLNNCEWHLFEYEINSCDVCALYRLELKFVDSKKSSKAKVASDSLVDLQRQMGRLNAENAKDNRRYSKGRTKANQKVVSENFYSAADLANQKVNDLHFYESSDQMGYINGNPVYGPSLPYGFSIEDLKQYYGT